MLPFLHWTILLYLGSTPHENTGGDFDPLGQIQVLALTALTSSQWDAGIFYKSQRTRKYFPRGAKYKNKTEQLDNELVSMIEKFMF